MSPKRSHTYQILLLLLSLLLIYQCAYVAGASETKKIVEKCGKAVVEIFFLGTNVNVKNGDSCDVRGRGSGFIISQDGYVLTALHVIGDGKIDSVDSHGIMLALRKIKVITHNGDTLQVDLPKPYPPNLGPDIGILKISNPVNLSYLQIAEVDSLELGEDVIVLGYPEPQLTVTQGIINTFAPTEETFRVSAMSSPGSSGSPVLNSNGKVIGIATYSGRTYTDGKKVCALFSSVANVVMQRKKIISFIEQDRNKSKEK